ncbi:hypothetical protein BsWGS_13260 [Bradybaena similaris]
MRKSSLGGRPSISGAPVRVLNDNAMNRGRSSSASSEDRLSYGGRLSFAGSSKLPVLNARKSTASSNAFSFLPKSGRPSSGIGVRGRTDTPKDPRPVSDKRFQAQCIRQLLEFLNSNNYSHPISQKLLVSPSSKDVFKIFEFIYGKFVRGYKQVPKMEEEVPKQLKMLGYPFVIQKTHMFSVGSHHVWPHVLAAFIWMIDLLQMTDSISIHGGIDAFIFEPKDDSFEGISEDKIFFDYYEKTYRAFMAGQDNFDDFNSELEAILSHKYQGGNMSDIQAENARLEEEVGLIGQVEERQRQLKERIEMSKRDKVVMERYINNLQQHKAMLETEFQKRIDEYEIIKSDLQTEKEKLAHLEEIYQRQDLTPADVERLKAEQEGLKQQLENLDKQIANIDTDNWNITTEQAKLNEKVEMEVASYNRLAIALKLVPETAELAGGKDFRLRTGFNSDIVGHFEDVLKPVLTSMKKTCTTELHQKSKERFQLAYEIEQFAEVINERKELVAQMTKELANKEAEIETMKQLLHSGKKTEELETLRQESIRLEALAKQAEAEKVRVTEEYQKASKLLSKRKEEVKNLLAELEDRRQKAKGQVHACLVGMKILRFILDSLKD